MADIVRVAIHPAIGFARVGNSPDGYFTGPEMPGTATRPEGGFKDADGSYSRVKRQAARFRVFGYAADGSLIGELTESEAKIEWRVQVANWKAEWDRFDGRRGEELPLSERRARREWRNADIDDDRRSELVIQPPEVTISGALRKARFDGGAFMGIPVYLGEARTDAYGRLLVFAGRGQAGSVEEGRRLVSYANNDRWYDDVADGPVHATVTLGNGTTLEAEPAWVVTAPPDFSPETPNPVTLYDVALDTAINAGWLAAPERPSFTRDIQPILQRALDITWTDPQALAGHRRLDNLFDWAELSRGDGEAAEKRVRLFRSIRNPYANEDEAKAQASAKFMPALAGDDGDCREGIPGTWLALTGTQYRMLEKWAQGDFESDWQGEVRPGGPPTPEMLDRAALEACAGGGFFPGIEGGWIFRRAEAYVAPFRLDSAKLKPGDVTKRMAVPWQADFFECRGWWWPAQRPDGVVPASAYRRLAQIERDLANPQLGHAGSDAVVRKELARERDALLAKRAAWARDLPDDEDEGRHAMVAHWSKLGFVDSVAPDGHRYEIDGKPILVESEKARSTAVDLADAFHRLVNIERYPEFRPVARELAERWFASADYGADANYAPFVYSVPAFRERMDKIYSDYVATIDDPHWLEEFSRAAVIENLRQKGPMNLVDGAWLQHIMSAGPSNDIVAKLFSIWADEAGNGYTELNHSNVYDTLLRGLDVYLPPITSRAFSELDLLPSAWQNPVFQLAVGLFPESFFPELLGMTLYLEWEATPTMMPIVRMLKKHHIDPQFYSMHMAIDNVTAGHGGLARDAVEQYLDSVRANGGEAAVQAQWKRVWNGYVTWATLGTFGGDLFRLLAEFDLRGDHEDVRRIHRERMLRLIVRKAPYARTAHGTRKLGAESLGSLFATPDKLLDALVSTGWVNPDSPRDSRFITELLSFRGPMYKVFSNAELDVLLDWIGSLANHIPPPQPGPVSAAERVRAAIERHTPDATTERRHEDYRLPDPAGNGKTVSEWFRMGDAHAVMVALAASEYVVKGDPAASRLLSEVFSNLMDGVLDDEEQDAFSEWIALDCPMVGEKLAATHKIHVFMASDHTEAASRVIVGVPFSARRQFIGAGAVH